MKTIKYPKHQRQQNRDPKNMTKSVRLDIKKYLNQQLKEIPNNPTLSPRVKQQIIESYTEIKSQFAKS